MIDRMYLRNPQILMPHFQESSVNFANDITYILLSVYQDYCFDTMYQNLIIIISQLRIFKKYYYFDQISNDIVNIIAQYSTENCEKYINFWFNSDIVTNYKYCDQALYALHHRKQIGKQQYSSYNEYVLYLNKKRKKLFQMYPPSQTVLLFD